MRRGCLRICSNVAVLFMYSAAVIPKVFQKAILNKRLPPLKKITPENVPFRHNERKNFISWRKVMLRS